MRQFFLVAAAAAAGLAAVPAAAQFHPAPWGWQHRSPDREAFGRLLWQLDRAERRIHVEARRGFISRREAHGLVREAGHLRGRLHWASRNGLSPREFYDLRRRVDRLERRLRHERRDWDGRRG